jgi:hypothetical protein
MGCDNHLSSFRSTITAALGLADAATWRQARSSVPPELTECESSIGPVERTRDFSESGRQTARRQKRGCDHFSTLPVEIRGNLRGRFASSAITSRHFRSRSAETCVVDRLRLTLLSPEAFPQCVYRHTVTCIRTTTRQRGTIGKDRDERRRPASGSPQSTPSRRRMCDCRERGTSGKDGTSDGGRPLAVRRASRSLS